MSSSSSDSSEDENIDQFKEALDPRFISDSMYSTNGNTTVAIEDSQKVKKLPSNRPVEEEFVSHHLKVTPEFQSFVSKQLSKLLDEKIKEVKKKKLDYPEIAENQSGIYLLRGSKSYLNSEEFSEDFVPRKKCKFKQKKNVDDVEQDMSGVVVTPEWVLNQEGTVGWQKNAKKSPLFSYKKSKKGILELIGESETS